MSMADTGGMLPGSGDSERREPGTFVSRRWLVFLFVGLGLFVGLFVPGVGYTLFILLFCTAELFIYVGVPLALIIWLFLLTRYFGHLGGKKLIGYAFKSGVVVVVTVAVAHLSLPFLMPGYMPQMMGFWCRVKVFADVEGIRTWGKTVELTDEETAQGINGLARYQGERPGCISQFGPTTVDINVETRAVRLTWRGGFGHWGLYVGPAGAGRPGGFTLMLEPGAYVWSETSRSRALRSGKDR